MCARKFRDGASHLFTKRIVAHLAPAVTDDGEALREASLQSKIIERGNQLSLREISGCAEDRKKTGVRLLAVAEPARQVIMWIAGHGRYSFFTAWPPNSFRRAAITLAEKESCWREANRAKSESISTGAGTFLSIAS